MCRDTKSMYLRPDEPSNRERRRRRSGGRCVGEKNGEPEKCIVLSGWRAIWWSDQWCSMVFKDQADEKSLHPRDSQVWATNLKEEVSPAKSTGGKTYPGSKKNSNQQYKVADEQNNTRVCFLHLQRLCLGLCRKKLYPFLLGMYILYQWMLLVAVWCGVREVGNEMFDQYLTHNNSVVMYQPLAQHVVYQCW